MHNIKENEGIFRRQDQIAVTYLNGLFKNFEKKYEKYPFTDEEHLVKDTYPKSYYSNQYWQSESCVICDDKYKTPVACPEIYVMDSKTMFMFLAWYDEKRGIFNRQTEEWITDFTGLSWCYKSELCPNLQLLRDVWGENGLKNKLVYTEEKQNTIQNEIDSAINTLTTLKKQMSVGKDKN